MENQREEGDGCEGEMEEEGSGEGFVMAMEGSLKKR